MNDFNPTAGEQSNGKPSMADRLLETVMLHKNVIIGALLLVLLGGGGVLFWMKQMQANEEKAALRLSEITATLETGDVKKALEGDRNSMGLKGLIRMYGGTPSGNMARLFLGSVYVTMNQPDSALAVYSSFSHKNKDLQASALAGSGGCYAMLKQYGKAAAAYEKASSTALNNALKANFLTKAAENHLAAGERDKARSIFEEIVRQYPGFSASAVAQRALWRISGE